MTKNGLSIYDFQPKYSITFENICEFMICAKFHIAGNLRAPGENLTNLFHSDFPIGLIYCPVLEISKNIKKYGLQMKTREKILTTKYDSDQGIPQNRKISKI